MQKVLLRKKSCPREKSCPRKKACHVKDQGTSEDLARIMQGWSAKDWLGPTGVNDMPMRGELRPVAARSDRGASAVRIGWWWISAAISNTDLQAVFFFCTIGLLATGNMILRFPDFGLTMAQLAVFP